MAQTRDRIGDVIAGRYELLDVVGRGGQGYVYRAHDRWMGRAVAVKLLTSAAAREPQMAQRLMREQQALSALKGTSAVELFDVCRGSEGEICLVMELLEGVDLEDHLYTLEQRGERLPLSRVVEIFDPIVETLEVAHAAGILHRDLKPGNIFLLDFGRVRLLDFGLARLSSGTPLTAAGTVLGSPSYIAPEAWAGRPEVVDLRADVYSLGVILYRVLAGELPFSGESLQDKFRGSTMGERPSLHAKRPDLPRDADEWVLEALAIDREERFQNVRALWNAFLSTFELEPPKRAKRKKRLWEAAKDVVHRLAGDEAEAAPAPRELSFVSEALAKSVAPPPSLGEAPRLGATPPEAGPQPEPPPAPRRQKPPVPPAPPRPAPPVSEVTVELTERDLHVAPPLPPRRAEKTVELTDLDLSYAEDTIPDARAPAGSEVTAPLGAEKKKQPTSKRNKRNKRRKKRKR